MMGGQGVVALVAITFAAVFASCGWWVAADTVILPPVYQVEGAPEKLLVLVIGAFVPPEAYVSLMKEIQAQTPLKLWIGIPDFLEHFPDPLTVDTNVDDVIATVKQQGFANLSNSRDVYLAGHSLGGIIAKGAEPGLGLAGLLLFASYLDYDGSSDLAHWKGPALTLGGEVDGLTRITRVAEEYAQYKQYVGSNPSQATVKPVVVLPGVSHSEFCSVRVSGDNPPYLNISLAKAQQLIGQVVSDFLVVNTMPPSSQYYTQAKNDLLSFVKNTEPLVNSFIQTQIMEKSTWCIVAQKIIANLTSSKDQQRLVTTERIYDNVVSFAISKPTLQNNTGVNPIVADISTCNYNTYELNPFDVSTIRVSADDLDCKSKSQAAILQSLGYPSAGQEADCAAVNQYAYQLALQAVTPTQRTRYSKYGKQLTFLPDAQYDTGLTWLASSLSFTASSNPNIYTVTSSVLETPLDEPFDLGGMHYCKLLSPARAVEWILVDSLK